MEDERRRKVEAGKEKLEAFRRLKKATNGQGTKTRNQSDNAVMNESGERSSESDSLGASASSCNVAIPRSSTSVSADSRDTEECNSMLSELEDVIAIKQDQMKATKNEIFNVGEVSSKISSVEDVDKFYKSKFDIYHTRLKDFQEAVVQRDGVIGQLKDSLQTVLAHKEKLSMDVQQLETTVATLQSQLQHATQFLDASPDSSPNKLLAVCQEQLLQCQDTLRLQLTKIETLTEEATQRDQELEKAKQELSSAKNQSAIEIQQLMGQVQQLHQESSTLRAEKDELIASRNHDLETLQSQLEEKFGVQLTQMKNELRQLQQQQETQLEEQHTLQIEMINNNHQLELAALHQTLKNYDQQQLGKSEETQNLQEKLVFLNSEIMKLSSDLAVFRDKASEAENVQVEIQQLTKHQHELNSELVILRKKVSENQFSHSEINRLNRNNARDNIELTYLREQARENENLHTELLKITEDCVFDMIDNNASPSSEVSTVKEQIGVVAMLRKRVQGLKEQNSNLTSELSILRQKADQSDMTIEKLNIQCKSLDLEQRNNEEKVNLELSELQKVLNENENIISQLRIKCVDLEKENETLILKIESFGTEKKNLQMEVSKLRSLQTKCDILQAECAGLLSEKKDVECEVTYLYSQLKHIKKLLAAKKDTNATEEPASFGFINEIDAIEQGVFSHNHLKVDIPTSPGNIIVWIEKCENLEKELLTAAANVTRLQTQLQNEEAKTKLVIEEKKIIQNTMKELQEKNSSLQKLSSSLSRSKQLLSQYEMKIADLQNEKESLTSSLEQLGEQLQKSETLYEGKIHNLQEKLCESLDMKSDSFEELILQSCANAKELVMTKENVRCYKDKELMLNNKIKFLTQLCHQQKIDLESSQDELQACATQLSDVWQKLTEKDEALAEKEREVSLCKLQVEQLEYQLQITNQQPSTNVQKELQSLIGELSNEVCELKVALTVEKSMNEKLNKESPGCNHSELVEKLQQQQKVINEMKTESDVEVWATRLEEQLGQMINDITAYSNQQEHLFEAQRVTGDLQQSLMYHRHQMEQILQDKAVLELQLQQEQNSLQGTKLQIQLLKAQLDDNNHKYEILNEQKERAEQELVATKTILDSKELFVQDLRTQLQGEIQHRDLQIKQLQLELRQQEVLHQVSQSNIIDSEECPQPSEEVHKLEELRTALDEIHSIAVSRLKQHLNEQLIVQEAELSEIHAKQVSELKQEHASQILELNQKLRTKEDTSRTDSHLQILTHLGLECTDLSQLGTVMQEKLKHDLSILNQGQTVPDEIFRSVKMKFKQLAQQQVLIAVAKVKEEQEASFVRQLSNQATMHKEEIAALTAKLQHQRKSELLLVRKELAELKRSYFESDQHRKASELVASLIKKDKDEYNKTVLQHLANTTQKKYTTVLNSLVRKWSTRCKEVVDHVTQQLETCTPADLTRAEELVTVKEHLIEAATQLHLDIATAHEKEIAGLRETLFKCHSALATSVSQYEEQEALVHQITLLREAVLEQHSELERLRNVIAEFEANSRGIDDIMRLKDEKHKLEMDELRTYFQKKCADLEKEYSEKVISQHSRNSSSSCSDGEINSAELTCADTEHSSRLFNITRRCETFSDASSPRLLEEQCRSELEQKLAESDEELDRVRITMERGFEAHIEKMKQEHEEHIRELARDLQNANEQELQSLALDHKQEMLQMQSIHEEVIRNLEKSHLEVLEQLRADLCKARNSEDNLRNQLEHLKLSSDAVKSLNNEQDTEHTASDNEVFEAALQEKLREHTEALAVEVEKMTIAIKEDAEREQAKLVAAHQETLAALIAQHQTQIETMRTRLATNNAEVLAQLHALHDDELRSAEERHRRAIETQSAYIRDEIVREQQRKTMTLLEEVAAAQRAELAAMHTRLTQTHEEEISRVRSSLESKLATVQANDARDMTEMKESFERQLHEQLEQARHEIVSTLGEQIQAVLISDETCPSAESLPAELRELQKRLVGEMKRELDETLIHHEEAMKRMREQYESELEEARQEQMKFNIKVADSKELRLECRLMRSLVSELLKYFCAIEEELNAFVEAIPPSDNESTVSSECSMQKRVHLVPDTKKFTSFIHEESISSDSVDDVRSELDRCLARARKEFGGMLKIGDMTQVARLLQQHGGSGDSHMEARLVASERKLQDLEMELQAAHDRLREHERKRPQRETVSEGYGEGTHAHHGLEERLGRLSEVQDRARSILAEANDEEIDPPHLLRLIEELCHEGDRLAEEAKRDKEDLQLQLEAADKQLRSTRVFLDEQAAEREQERDEFGREVTRLQEALNARDRDRLESGRLTKETQVRDPTVMLTYETCDTSTNLQHDSASHVECLESQVKDITHRLQESEKRVVQLNADLKAAKDKVSVLRDVIHNLEIQLDNKTKSEANLRRLLSSLQLAFDKSNNDLANKWDETLEGEALTDQIAELQDRVRFYTLQLEQLRNSSPAVRDMKAQIQAMESTLDRRTRELERLHSSAISTCSSPSEDMSGRGADLLSPRAPQVQQQSPERPCSPITLRRLQERLDANGRAEEAACKRVRDLEIQLNTARTAEEEMQMERQSLQQRVEQQLLQISELQAALDQQRLAQAAVDARDAAATRRQLQNAAERLDQARDLVQSKENELAELRTQLEKMRKVITTQEEALSRQTREFHTELEDLHAQLDEAKRDKEALEKAAEEHLERRNSRLLDSLLAEKNAEIDELGNQVSFLREKLENISLRMASDITRSDIQELVREVRMAHGELRNHCTALHSTLHSSHSEPDVIRKAKVDSSSEFLSPPHSVINYEEPSYNISDRSRPITPMAPTIEVRVVRKDQQQHQMESLLPLSPATPVLNNKDFEALESELAAARVTVNEREVEIIQMKSHLQEHSNKLNEDVARLKEENNQLRAELTAVTGRMEEYAHLMQSEMEQSNEHVPPTDGQSRQSETLQHLIARVHKSGFEVLSASEVSLLHHRTRALLQYSHQTVATQTSRSGFAETKQLLDLQQQLTDTQHDAYLNAGKLIEKIESLESGLAQERRWVAEARQAQDEAESSLAAERRAREDAFRARSDAEAALTAERQSATEIRQAHASQSEELRILSEKAEEVKSRVQSQDRMVKMLKYELEKEEMHVASLESQLAAEHLNNNRTRAQLEGETARHHLTMARNTKLTEMLDQQAAKAQEVETTLKQSLEREEQLRQFLQEQVDALKRDKDLDTHSREIKASLTLERQRNAELLTSLKQDRERLATELQQCEKRERSRAEAELILERETTAAARKALEEAQSQLDVARTAMKAEHEEVIRLSKRIRELEEQVSVARETARMENTRAQKERADHEQSRFALEQTLALLQDRKKSMEQEVEQLRQQLAAVSEKWERQKQREFALSDFVKAPSDSASNSAKEHTQYLEEELIRCRAMLDRQSARLAAEQRAWASERAQLGAQLRNAQNEALASKTLLSTERAAWVMERQRLNDTSSRSVSPHSEIADQQLEYKIQYLFGKCQRTESWRKNLVWQKRYLLIVLRTCQETQDRLKSVLVQLSSPRHTHLLNAPPSKASPLQRFKVAALVILAIHRIRYIMFKNQRACAVGSSAITLRVANALIMSPEPRLEPPLQTSNGISEASGFSPPTRDETSTDEPQSPRYVYNGTPRSRLEINEFYLRSEMLQHKLGLTKTTTKPV